MSPRKHLAILLGSLVFCGCGGSQKKAQPDDDTLVPEETQKRAGEQQGQQQMMMDELGMTPADQAAQRHDNATRPAENPKYGKDKKK